MDLNLMIPQHVDMDSARTSVAVLDECHILWLQQKLVEAFLGLRSSTHFSDRP